MDLASLGIDVAPADTADTVDIDTSADEGTSDDAAAPEPSESGDAPEGEAEPATEDVSEPATDGRAIPPKYKALFKADKDLRALWFQAQEFKKHFESPAKATELIEQLEAHGGLEGITQTQAEFAEIDRMFATGEKALLDKFLAKPDNKAGFAKLGPALFDEFRKVDEGGWTHEIAKVMASTLAQAGIGNDIHSLATMLKDNPEAFAVVKKIAALVGGIDQLAAAAPKPKVDPEREKLEKDRADLERSKSDLFLAEVNNGIGVHIEKGIKESLEPYVKGRKLDKESYSIIEANVGGELTKLLNADPTFTSQKDAVLKSGDKARIQKFFTTKITKHLPDATKRVMRAFGSAAGTPVTTTAVKGTPTANGVVKLSKPPSPSEIDYKKSGNMIMDSKAILKSGKTVTWD